MKVSKFTSYAIVLNPNNDDQSLMEDVQTIMDSVPYTSLTYTIRCRLLV